MALRQHHPDKLLAAAEVIETYSGGVLITQMS
jgi:hypothetical protein